MLTVQTAFTLFPWWSLNFSADYQFNPAGMPTSKILLIRAGIVFFFAGATVFDFNKLKMQASLLSTVVHDEISIFNSQAAGGGGERTPTAILSYRPFSPIDFNCGAFYKRIFRMPTLNDLYYTFIGNTDLEPEYTNQYNIGFTYSKDFTHTSWLKRIEIQTDFYYNEVENKIIRDRPSSGPAGR